MKQLAPISHSVLLSIATGLIISVCALGMAQAAPRNLTAIVNPAGGGITIVDQVSGVVTQCAIRANFPNNIATCVRVGKATPNATVPTPPAGLSVYLVQTTNSSTGAVLDVPGIWLVNNSTGDVTYCNAIDSGGTPGGSCTDLGIVSST